MEAGHLLYTYQKELEELKEKGNFRSLNHTPDMLNLSSNDYLGIAADISLREQFLSELTPEYFLPTSSSSRLLTGNHPVYDELERLLAEMFGAECALVFNSGYHMNTGILPAISDEQTLILADKLVHASLIDGIRLSQARCIRYRHTNYEQLESLIHMYHTKYEKIIIVTESIFSMDGDEADLNRLVSLKKQYSNILLYVDEAHGVGARGSKGLGCAEEQNCIEEIDFLTGTFGKALASVGGYIVCRRVIRDYLVNKMRTLIFTTALPPINLMWTKFVLERIESFNDKREHLKEISAILKKKLISEGYDCPSTSHIIPIMIGDSKQTVLKAEEMKRKGFYLLPVRPPTVPEGTARIRVSLNADIRIEDIERLPIGAKDIRAKDVSPLPRNLLLFFAGWGMDEHPFIEYHQSNYDLFICYDYSDLSFDFSILKSYTGIKVVAWSMGVWVASQVLQGVELPIIQRVALNGTLYPVDDRKGIPTAIFEKTLAGLNEQTLKKFRRRMCGSPERLNSFCAKVPQRSIRSLYEELKEMREMVSRSPVPAFKWDKVYISKQDKIFPFENQLSAWQGQNIEIIEEEEHYLGDKVWKEIFAEF